MTDNERLNEILDAEDRKDITAPEGPARVVDTKITPRYSVEIGTTRFCYSDYKSTSEHMAHRINRALSPLVRKAEMCGRMAKVLELVRHHVKASAGASHLTDGFGKSKPNGNDFDLASIDDILAEYGREG
jgi:hypothetical protein